MPYFVFSVCTECIETQLHRPAFSQRKLSVGSALVSIYQTDVTSFSQLSTKYKSFENETKPNSERNPNQIEGGNHL